MRFPTTEEREKRQKLIELIDQGLIALTLDPRQEEVVVPEHLKKGPRLLLNLSRNFHLPTLEFEPLCIKASLSFGGQRFLCVLPYQAIYMVQRGEEVYFFPESAPPELTRFLESKGFMDLMSRVEANSKSEVAQKESKKSEAAPKKTEPKIIPLFKQASDDDDEDEPYKPDMSFVKDDSPDSEVDDDDPVEDSESAEDSKESSDDSPDDDPPPTPFGRPKLRLV